MILDIQYLTIGVSKSRRIKILIFGEIIQTDYIAVLKDSHKSYTAIIRAVETVLKGEARRVDVAAAISKQRGDK